MLSSSVLNLHWGTHTAVAMDPNLLLNLGQGEGDELTGGGDNMSAGREGWVAGC